MCWETLKIFGLTEREMKVSCTAVRIPILRAHSEAITIETEKEVSPNDVRYENCICILYPSSALFLLVYRHL